MPAASQVLADMMKGAHVRLVQDPKLQEHQRLQMCKEFKALSTLSVVPARKIIEWGKQAVERVRRMTVETAPQELTDTPSLSPRSQSSCSGQPQPPRCVCPGGSTMGRAPLWLRIHDKHWENSPIFCRAGALIKVACAGSMHGSQMSMHTALDLVLLLLDDVDAGQTISPGSTKQLRAILLSNNGVTPCMHQEKSNMATIMPCNRIGHLMTKHSCPTHGHDHHVKQ